MAKQKKREWHGRKQNQKQGSGPEKLSLERILNYITRGGIVQQLRHGSEVVVDHKGLVISLHLLLGQGGLLLHLDAKDLGLGHSELHLELRHLVLQVRDRPNTSIHWISHPRCGFIDQAADGVRSLMNRELLHSFNARERGRNHQLMHGACWNWGAEESDLQHLANVAGTKDLVDDGEFVGVVGREVGSKDAVFGAASP